MTRERIDSLEADKERLEVRVNSLLAELGRLRDAEADGRAEVARLGQALGDFSIISSVATVFIAVGGVGVSYATFIDAGQIQLANLGLGMLGCGVIVFLANTLMGRWAKK